MYYAEIFACIFSFNPHNSWKGQILQIRKLRFDEIRYSVQCNTVIQGRAWILIQASLLSELLFLTTLLDAHL